MTREAKRLAVAAMALLLMTTAGVATAQTSTPGADIDVEIYNADGDGSNLFCVAPSTSFWAYVYVRPGSSATSCALTCGAADGGPANIATGVIDVGFDTAMLTYAGAENNPATAAQDGLIQTQNLAEGRLGWGLSGDFAVNGDPNSGLNDPCAMAKLDVADWTFRVQFTTGAVQGTTGLTLRGAPVFPLSFADVCGSAAFVEGGGVDEVIAGTVVVSSTCASLLFADGFETGSTAAWSVTVD